MADEKMIKAGVAGCFSCQDEYWDEKGNSELYEIYISHGDWIHSIQFQYVKNETLVMSELHGIYKGPKFNLIRLKYPSEFLTGISGDCLPSHKISSLKITTNKQVYGPFGRPTKAHDFDFQFGNSKRFAGFYGYCDKTRNNCLAALGVYFKPSTKLETITCNCISAEGIHTDDDSCTCVEINDPSTGRRKNEA